MRKILLVTLAVTQFIVFDVSFARSSQKKSSQKLLKCVRADSGDDPVIKLDEAKKMIYFYGNSQAETQKEIEMTKIALRVKSSTKGNLEVYSGPHWRFELSLPKRDQALLHLETLKNKKLVNWLKEYGPAVLEEKNYQMSFVCTR